MKNINELPYTIDSQPDNNRKLDNGEENPNFRKTYWIIGEINYNKKIP
jgi:hypothetical protein